MTFKKSCLSIHSEFYSVTKCFARWSHTSHSLNYALDIQSRRSNVYQFSYWLLETVVEAFVSCMAFSLKPISRLRAWQKTNRLIINDNTVDARKLVSISSQRLVQISSANAWSRKTERWLREFIKPLTFARNKKFTMLSDRLFFIRLVSCKHWLENHCKPIIQISIYCN